MDSNKYPVPNITSELHLSATQVYEQIISRPCTVDTDREALELITRLAGKLPLPDKAQLIADLTWKVMPDQITVDLDANTAVRNGVCIQLTPRYAVVLNRLVLDYPMAVSIDSICRDLWGVLRTEQSRQHVRLIIFYLRDRLKPLNATIVNRVNRGYRLELNRILI